MTDPNHYADMYNAYEKTPKKIRILDSTLREGEQHPGVSFTNKQRIQIAWMLDYFGVDQIEISPVVSPDHKEATKTIIQQGLRADIVSHGRALREDIDTSLSCDAKWVAAYLGISDIHLKDKNLGDLSGGEFQRVLLARAISKKPELLVLDEPVQGVDYTGEIALYELIKKISDKLNCGILLICLLYTSPSPRDRG